jgi:hypothetical protein
MTQGGAVMCSTAIIDMAGAGRIHLLVPETPPRINSI